MNKKIKTAIQIAVAIFCGCCSAQGFLDIAAGLLGDSKLLYIGMLAMFLAGVYCFGQGMQSWVDKE